MKHAIRRLPDAELEVMKALWNCDIPATRAEIQEKLAISHPMALTTLLTLLSRLAEKGFLDIEKQGRGNCYTPKINRQDYLASQSRRFLDQLCGGSLTAFANALCHSGLSQEELQELRTLLERDAL